MITIEWTDEKKSATIEAIDKWLKDKDCGCGETLMQSDRCLISLPEMVADLVDDIIKPKYSYDE